MPPRIRYETTEGKQQPMLARMRSLLFWVFGLRLEYQLAIVGFAHDQLAFLPEVHRGRAWIRDDRALRARSEQVDATEVTLPIGASGSFFALPIAFVRVKHLGGDLHHVRMVALEAHEILLARQAEIDSPLAGEGAILNTRVAEAVARIDEPVTLVTGDPGAGVLGGPKRERPLEHQRLLVDRNVRTRLDPRQRQ